LYFFYGRLKRRVDLRQECLESVAITVDNLAGKAACQYKSGRQSRAAIFHESEQLIFFPIPLSPGGAIFLALLTRSLRKAEGTFKSPAPVHA
jgi:hypothetical protein